MQSEFLGKAPKRLRRIALGLALVSAANQAFSAGVTIITHGYNGDVNGWVTGMARQVPEFPAFPGTNFTEYTISVTYSGGSYHLATTRTAGSAPSATDSGEIIIRLDWSQLAGGVFSTYSTYDVAGTVALGLLQTNLIGGLAGHALLELPVHLIGHSRGGSLISEISRVLGTNGVWVDQLTTLDPHPLNNDGFNDIPVGVDAPVRTYANVLFHDNYWQHLGDGLFDPVGEPVAGAYVRQLFDLSGGYNNTGSVAGNHSNVHLWYYGTMDLGTPASDTEASIGSSERSAWWVGAEAVGTNAGFVYSLIGGKNRTSTEQPLGPGYSAIQDGVNQLWDLGAGLSANRTALTSNSGGWPNLIRLNLLDTNAVVPGDSVPVKFYYQWAKPPTSQGTMSLYLDDDGNPLNGTGPLLSEFAVPGTRATNVSYASVSVPLTAVNVSPGTHFICGKITGGGRTRYLYAPEPVTVLAAGPLTMDIAQSGAGQIQIRISGTAGEIIVLEQSPDLQSWESVATNTLSGSAWTYDVPAASETNQFFRAHRLGAGTSP